MFLKKSQIWIVVIVFSSILQSLYIPSLSCMESRDKFFLDLALKDPVVTLDETCAVALAAKSRFDAAVFSYDSFKQIVSDIEIRYPIFLLGKYINRGSLRKTIIDEIAANILAKLNSIKDRPVEYVNFAARGYFVDFIIAAKVLSQKPDANLSIHLIDNYNFTNYVSCRALFGDSRAITQDFVPRFVDKMFLSAEFAKESLGRKYPYEVEDDQALLKSCFMVEEGARQFVNFFKRMFPSAHLTLFLHENSGGYFAYITQRKIQPADVTDSGVTDSGAAAQGVTASSERDLAALFEKLKLR